ncbi:MAG: glycosyltransferase [Gemmatimonadaceae bacterium]
MMRPPNQWAARPWAYVSIFAAWFASVLWFHPRLIALLDMAKGPVAHGAVLFFVVFTEVAWLYGFYNVGVVLFAIWYRRSQPAAAPVVTSPRVMETPVALLYVTCNDFVEESAASCLAQDYPSFTLYLLDDSSDSATKARIDQFAERDPRIRVVRRPDRRGFKAGNLNHGLTTVAMEPLFVIADADEILPTDFLRRMVPRLMSDPSCGFVQANHRCNPAGRGTLKAAVGVGIDIHWRWYHPLRNRFGFVMLLGHGAIIRHDVWESIGGFPEIVSEDLAFSLRAREQGWHGVFAEDVVCLEEFPETMRAFRVRHMKWTRGTCEFFAKEMWPALRSPNIPVVEKLDVLFPALSLPLALVYFLFVIDANVLFTLLFTHPQPLTLVLAGRELVVPVRALDAGFSVVNTWDFFLITLLTFLSPILCFIIDLWRQPKALLRFLCQSSVIYAALGPMSSLGVLGYLITRKATFLVTGDKSAGQTVVPSQSTWVRRTWNWVRRAITGSHPDHPLVQAFEVTCGIGFAAMCLQMMQVSFLGLAIGITLMPILHHVPWNNATIQRVIYLPFSLMVGGLMLGGLGLLGMQPVFFGYGFHF